MIASEGIESLQVCDFAARIGNALAHMPSPVGQPAARP